MRILLDLQACQATNRQRGIGRYSMSLGQAMARHAGRHDIRIMLNSRFPETIEPIRRAFDNLVAQKNIVVFDAPALIAEHDPSSTWRCRAAERVREIFIGRFAPDIVHVSSIFEGFVDDAVTSIGHLDERFDTAVTLYDLIPLMRKDIYLADPRVRDWYYRKLQSLKNAELLLAISDHSRNEAVAALQLPESRVINISSAVDNMFRPHPLSTEETIRLKSQYGLSKPFLMYTGGIDPRKNIEGLIQAFALLPGAIRKQYQLAIICKITDSDRRRLTSLASQFGLASDEVTYTGFVTDEDLIALYKLCTLFVFPSLHEGFGLPALEAMSCGAPVIGSNASSIPEVIGRADALFDPTDIPAMSAKIGQALNDDGFRASLREHGLRQSRLFSWDASAKRALEAFEHLHERKQQSDLVQTTVRQPRPRLAYISPLPPEKSGIADYSAELLPELARYYDIDVVVEQNAISDHVVAANFPIRSAAWFEAHADQYDRIIYHFGNSNFHQHMFGLLSRHAGIVVLHDFFLSGIVNYLDRTGYLAGAYTLALYQSHGYRALIEEQQDGREASFWKYPCNKAVLDYATGVIVHSQFSMQLADTWYGPGSAQDWQSIPLLRAIPSSTTDRRQARQAVGLKEADFAVCSFGMLGPTKLNNHLLDAWLASPLAHDERCHLIFVGENSPGSFGDELLSRIAKSGCSKRIKITGFVSPETYRAYLASADVAVQLRSRSRGETSASILDCLSYGIPTIINANGSAVELPQQTLIKLQDAFAQQELSQALKLLWTDAELRDNLSRQAVEYVRSAHHPARVGEAYRDAIERFSTESASARYQRVVSSLAAIAPTTRPTEQDLLATATSLAANEPSKMPRQLLVDVSELVQRDAKSGIQRVVRNVLHVMLNTPLEGYRIEPVYDAGGHYVYARQFTLDFLGISNVALEDAPIQVHADDIFLGLDLLPNGVPRNRPLFVDFKNRGVKIFFVVFDLLPLLRPDVFVYGAQPGFLRWLDTVVTVSDGVVCISRAVADELLSWMEEAQPKRISPLKVGYFHLGADIATSASTLDLAKDTYSILQQVLARPSLLMVGTLEPRKGHAQALAAFEILWDQGIEANLVIVGKHGWMVEPFVAKLKKHPQAAKRLFWLEGASDATLLKLYETSSALLSASEGEGFGLPLIEAAQHKLPIIARDLPVFREVAGEHAFYFEGTTAEALAEALRQWFALYADRRHPTSKGLRWLTWAESTQQLLNAIMHHDWYRTVPAP